jgi:DNA-directed RNA polymerase sigma subunit (sigma70/sigma32)
MARRRQYSDYHMSQEEIAKVLNISRAEVQQTEYRALKKLKRSGRLEKFFDAKDDRGETTWQEI